MKRISLIFIGLLESYGRTVYPFPTMPVSLISIFKESKCSIPRREKS